MPLTMSMSVAQLLKKETASAHVETEKLLAPRLANIQSYGDYASILKMFYGFFHPLECVIRSHVTPAILADIDERRNASLLLIDLKTMGYYSESLSLCGQLPKINSSLAALGAMYVMEGSTLGGRMISRMLMKNPHVPFGDSNLHFFNGYKEDTGKRWTGFLSVLEEHGEHVDTIVAAANETFICLTKWMEETL
ncbi:MAG: biliverdin-producing heme oxygenase [Flavisolibacter sp.]